MSAQPASQYPDYEPQDELLIESIDALKVVFDPRRMRVLEAFAAQPRTVREVAEELGVTPHSLYYHVNMLEEHDLLIVTGTRMVSGILEKHYQVAARNFIIAPGLLSFGEGGNEGLDILLRTVLDDTRVDIRRSARSRIIDLTRKSPDPDALLVRRGLTRMTRDQARVFYERMLALLDELTAVESDAPGEGDQPYAFALAFYPTSMSGDDQGNDSP